MPKTSPGTSLLREASRPVRWSIWLAAGIVFGLVLGFVAGLAKPRIRK
jgi:hypothetical protein